MSIQMRAENTLAERGRLRRTGAESQEARLPVSEGRVWAKPELRKYKH